MPITPDRIERDIVIEAPVDVVWRVVTEPEHIARWFSDAADVDLRPGGAGALTFTSHDHVAPFVVATVEPPTTFAFRWSHPDGEEPVEGNSTLVTFSLAAEGSGATRLTVVESGIQALPLDADGKQRFHDDHVEGWGTHIPELGRYAPGAVAGAGAA
jgi:uncharacterized protein YndB with AHSA1/START domain